MLKARCKTRFNERLRAKYPFLEKRKSESDVFCLKCRSIFSIAAGGNTDIIRHISTKKHQRYNFTKESIAPKRQPTLDIDTADNDCLQKCTTSKDQYTHLKDNEGDGSTSAIKQRMDRLNILDSINYIPPETISTIKVELSDEWIPSAEFSPATELPKESPIIPAIEENITKQQSDTECGTPNPSDWSKKTDDLMMKNKIIEDTLQENLIIKRDVRNSPLPDHIDLFLQSLGQTIRTFPAMHISDIKIDLLKLVTDWEKKVFKY